jgi:hypothetical protein
MMSGVRARRQDSAVHVSSTRRRGQHSWRSSLPGRRPAEQHCQVWARVSSGAP